MIEPTDEMRAAFRAAVEGFYTCAGCLNHRLAAVLAIVERDQAAEAHAVADLLAVYRASKAKGYYAHPRGPVAWALHALDQASAP